MIGEPNEKRMTDEDSALEPDGRYYVELLSSLSTFECMSVHSNFFITRPFKPEFRYNTLFFLTQFLCQAIMYPENPKGPK